MALLVGPSQVVDIKWNDVEKRGVFGGKKSDMVRVPQPSTYVRI